MRPEKRVFNTTRLLTAIRSTIPINERVLETLSFKPDGLPQYRLSEYHHIKIVGNTAEVLDPNLDLEAFARKLNILGPYDSYAKEIGNG